MKKRLLSVAALAVLAALSLAGLNCDPPSSDLAIRAHVVVTRAGAPEIGTLVTFTTDKLTGGGGVEGGSRLTSGEFTDFLGYADFLFGYKLDYDSENGFFIGSARIVAAVTDNGTVYADTTRAGNGVPITKGAVDAETLKINLPAR